MYKAEGKIIVARVVASSMEVEIANPTVVKALQVLLASYYVWNVQYPPTHLSVLSYSDAEIIETLATKTVVKKLIRNIDYSANQEQTT